MALAAAELPVDQPRIVGRTTVGSTCVVKARDSKGSFPVIVTWSPCEEIRVRITSIGELAKTDQLQGLACTDIRAIAVSNQGYLVSAWGSFAATVYVRDGSGTREVTIAD